MEHVDAEVLAAGREASGRRRTRVLWRASLLLLVLVDAGAAPVAELVHRSADRTARVGRL